MQGRVYPDRTGVLQEFPSKKWKDEFYEMKKLGFDYIELLYDVNENRSNPLTYPTGVNEVLDISTSSKINLYSICADYFTSASLLDTTDLNPMNRLGRLIVYANKLSISIIVIPFLNKNSLDNQEDLLHFLRTSEKATARGYEAGVQLCIETSLHAEKVLSAFRQIESTMRVCYDIGNATALGYDIRNEIRVLGEIIAHVHIKDRQKNNGPNVMIGNGDVNFAAGFETLNEINYQGNFTLETALGDNPTSSAEKHLNKVRDFVSHLS